MHPVSGRQVLLAGSTIRSVNPHSLSPATIRKIQTVYRFRKYPMGLIRILRNLATGAVNKGTNMGSLEPEKDVINGLLAVRDQSFRRSVNHPLKINPESLPMACRDKADGFV